METKLPDSVFNTLNKIDVSEHIEKKKNGQVELSYLSWAWAWAEVKKRYPDAVYTIYRSALGQPYFEDSNFGLMCYTSVTIEGQELGMWLPVMDGANKALCREPYTYTVKDKFGSQTTKTVQAATMFDINKTIMRCLVKNLAMFGLGLYIYAGEDLPENVEIDQVEQPKPSATPYIDAARAKEPSGNAKLLAEIQAADTVIKLQAIQARMDKADLSDALRDVWQKEINRQGSKLKATLTPGDGWVANADLFTEEE